MLSVFSLVCAAEMSCAEVIREAAGADELAAAGVEEAAGGAAKAGAAKARRVAAPSARTVVFFILGASLVNDANPCVDGMDDAPGPLRAPVGGLANP